MLRKHPLLLLLALSSLFAKAQDVRKLSENIFSKTLPNGLDVVVVEDHSVPLVTLELTFKAGAINQTPADEGLIGLYLDEAVRGTKDYPNLDNYNYLGGGLGVTGENRVTSAEYSTFFLTLPKENFTAGLKYLGSPVRFPLLRPADLEKEKEITADQVKQKSANPSFELNREMLRQLWGDQAASKDGLGDTAVVNTATPEKMYKIKQRYFNPDNALLIIGGDITHDDAFAEAETAFGDWQSDEPHAMALWQAPEFKPLERSKHFIVASDIVRTPTIYLSWHGPDTRNDVNATYAADVFSYILNQSSSKLSQSLVQSGLATNVSISYLTLKHTGPISLLIAPNPARVKECYEEVKRQLALMDNDDYITDNEIATAKRILEITDIRREDVTSDFVHTLSFWWTSATLDYYFTYLDNLRKVSRADLKRYVDKYIKNQPYCAGMLINPELRAQVKADDFFNSAK